MEVAVYLNKIIMKFLKSKRLGNHFKRINKATDGGARGWRVRTLPGVLYHNQTRKHFHN